jgi:hypothetical protein
MRRRDRGIRRLGHRHSHFHGLCRQAAGREESRAGRESAMEKGTSVTHIDSGKDQLRKDKGMSTNATLPLAGKAEEGVYTRRAVIRGEESVLLRSRREGEMKWEMSWPGRRAPERTSARSTRGLAVFPWVFASRSTAQMACVPVWQVCSTGPLDSGCSMEWQCAIT